MIEPRSAFARVLQSQDRAIARVITLLEESPPSAWRRPYRPGGWTMATIAAHLQRCLEEVNHALRRTPPRFESASPDAAAPLRSSLKQRLRAFVVLTLGHIPARGVPSPEIFQPPEDGASRSTVIDALSAARQETLSAYESAYQSGRRVRLSHPVLGVLGLRQWARFQTVHFRHHERQLREVLRDALAAQQTGRSL